MYWCPFYLWDISIYWQFRSELYTQARITSLHGLTELIGQHTLVACWSDPTRQNCMTCLIKLYAIQSRAKHFNSREVYVIESCLELKLIKFYQETILLKSSCININDMFSFYWIFLKSGFLLLPESLKYSNVSKNQD